MNIVVIILILVFCIVLGAIFLAEPKDEFPVYALNVSEENSFKCAYCGGNDIDKSSNCYGCGSDMTDLINESIKTDTSTDIYTL